MSGALRYLAVIEKAGRTFSAFVPDLPGCVATGRSPAAVEEAIREAVEFHLDGLREDGIKIPRPSARGSTVAVPAPPAPPKSRRSRAA